MFNMPFFGFPYYRNYYSKYYSPNKNNLSTNNNKINEENYNKNQNSTTSNNTSSTNENSRFNLNNDNPFINIFGLDLYSDDILIICILLSLYLEGVKDQMLFISLILLLLS